VKAIKHHLRRVLGEATLTYEEMATLLAQVEACLNSRPLQALTDDPDDLTALTPGHFLIGSHQRRPGTEPSGHPEQPADSMAATATDARPYLDAVVSRVLTVASSTAQVVEP